MRCSRNIPYEEDVGLLSDRRDAWSYLHLQDEVIQDYFFWNRWKVLWDKESNSDPSFSPNAYRRFWLTGPIRLYCHAQKPLHVTEY